MSRLWHLILIACLFPPAANALAQTGDGSNAAAARDPALRQELLKMAERDQAVRNELIKAGVRRPGAALLERMAAIDAANTERVRAIVRERGWPSPELVGRDGTEAAFLIVQHAALSFQQEMLPLVRGAYLAGNLAGQDYALLLDRVLVGEGKPQVYGTQAKPFDQWKGRQPSLYPIEGEANVDQRRAKLGLPPLAVYLELLKQLYFPRAKPRTRPR